MKNRLFAIGAMILMMTSCMQDELISSDNGKEPATAGSCLTLVGLSSPQTRVSIGDKTGDVYPVLWSEGDALGVFSRTAGTDINNVQSLLSDESIGQNSGVFTSDDVKMAEEGATELLIYYPYRASTELAENGNKITSTLSVEQEQSRPGDSHHIGKYGFAFAKATVSSPDMLAKFTLNHAMAYVKFSISSQELSTYKLKSVSLYDKETKTPLSGVFIADLDTDELTYGTDVKPYATVSLTTPELLASAQDIYLTTYPADLSGKEVYIVITLENDQQTVTIPILKEGKQLKAKGLLSYMLSLPDDWDYSLKGLTIGCKDGLDSVRTAVLELEEHGYVRRQKVRNAKGQIIDYDYQVYESPVEDAPAVPGKEGGPSDPSATKSPKSRMKPCSSPFLDFPNLAEPNLEKATQQNTNKQNTKRQSTNLSGPTGESADFDQMEAQVREKFRERLEIDTLAQRYDPDKLEELLDNIVEMYCCPRQTQYVGKQPQTTKAIRLRLDKLTSQHVEYIFDVMSNTTQPIKNIMAYLRTTILNAPTTMEHYYQAQGNWLTAQNRKK